MLGKVTDTLSLWILPGVIVIVLTLGLVKKVPLYETFTDGAKEGFKVAVNIIPYLVAIIVGISMLRASGAIENLAEIFAPLLSMFNIPAEVTPIMIVRSLSGSAALGVFSDIAHNMGASYATTLAAVMVGSSETTFYVLAVYFGAVGISKYRYALIVGILADVIGIIAAVSVCNLMFAR